MIDHNIKLDSILVAKGNRDLSDGQIQRILLARTFLVSADLILLDEPTSNLDEKNRIIILEAIRSYSSVRNFIITCHNNIEYDERDSIIDLNSLN